MDHEDKMDQKDPQEDTPVPDEPIDRGEKEETDYTGVFLPMGTGLGISLGIVFDNLAMGIAMGTALGLLIGAIVNSARNKK